MQKKKNYLFSKIELQKGILLPFIHFVHKGKTMTDKSVANVRIFKFPAIL